MFGRTCIHNLHLIPSELCSILHLFTRNVHYKRVVITGLGVVSPLGVGVDRNWQRIIAGESGLKDIREKDKFGDVQTTAYIDEQELDLEARFNATQRRTHSLATLFALIASDEAMVNSGLDQYIQSDIDGGSNIGVSLGQGMLDLNYIFEALQKKKLSPHFITRVLPNMPAGNVAIKHGLKGPNLCASTACASGLHSIGDAFEVIRRGSAQAMLAGSTESCLNKIGVEAFARMRALSSRKVGDGASRPFDQQRDGFVLGEGCGILVLEELGHALNRKAHIRGEVHGFGATGDAHHITQPDVDGWKRSMMAALKQAQLESHNLQVTYVNAHATSTPLGDDNELKACEAVFGSQASSICISSCKGAIGHLLGASGAVESVFTVLALQHGTIPPNISITNKMVSEMDIVTDCRKWPGQRRVALKNSFGFGGSNASIVYSNYVD